MENIGKRKFRKDQQVYLIDCWKDNKEQPYLFVRQATIVEVDASNELFTVNTLNGKCQTYTTKDYGVSIFDSQLEADRAILKLPTPKSTVYTLLGKRVSKKIVHVVQNDTINGCTKLTIHFTQGGSIAVEEIGSTLFLSKTEAMKAAGSL